MIRLFKHYIPHAVILLGLFDIALLIAAGEFAWRLRAGQIGVPIGEFASRLWPHIGFAAMILSMARIRCGRCALPLRGCWWRSRLASLP
jgi:hypothetical protein